MVLLPQAWLKRMEAQLRDEMPAFLNAMEQAPLRGIRMNPRKLLPGILEWEDLKGAVPWEKHGRYLSEDSQAGVTVWHEAGVFYLQEPSAMIPGAVMDVKPGETVLDLCAAPGGKATQMGAALEGKGLLVANEPVEKRARILSRNIERLGLPNAIVTCARPEQLAEKWPERFDAVMVDAPCSGEGMFRRDPAAREEWTAENAAGCVRRQREILSAAARMAKPGGRLVYSTCTYNPAENEETVLWFLEAFPEFERSPFQLSGADGREGWFTAYPHRVGGEGQFAALMIRRGSRETGGDFVPDLPHAEKKSREIWAQAFPGMPEATHQFGNTLVHLEMSPPLQGIRVLRAGLHLGELRGRIPIPDHAAAVGFPGVLEKRCEVTEAEAAKYLAGETLERPEEGWVLVQLHGVALGWAKGSGGTLRNHYPKGLRNHRILCELPIPSCQKTEKEI